MQKRQSPPAPTRSAASGPTRSAAPAPTLSALAVRAQPVPPAPIVGTIRVDPVQTIDGFVAELTDHLHRAVSAAQEGRNRDAALATAAMQALLSARKGMLVEALASMRSKRVHPETRAKLRALARAALPPLDDGVRALKAKAKAGAARQAAIGAALRAAHSRPASVYTANARQGVRRPEQIVRHCVAVTV
ncbi:hypothetical protein HL658_26800 [Azospirillum sp. RWY-5-1]|uniref:Uncharacterized protein n=1 Tax=Azospirillum oleiclasticum TaxID=2735135 RepID=A0ABX2TIB0_9PROT|nr:hypothetical protein [Azospirillum oleiclasticum]NYZ16166.1 hypothetical protein [Azospirillum oleiclasticum]NYZ23046.1 hypothetical protein [Azospirillum oleiclasticum]